jgi:ATP-dependent Lon protease
VLIPKENVIDLKDVPDAVKQDIEIIPVETVEDVLRETLGIDLPRIEHVLMFAKTPEGRRISA